MIAVMSRKVREYLALSGGILIALSTGCTGTVEAPSVEGPESVAPVSQKIESEGGFVNLFNGQDLKGWHRHMGVPEDYRGGKWEVVDGVIEGDQDPPGKGGFLVTDVRYRDFVVKMEIQVDYPNDSGVFLRMGEDGKSHQVTLDNEDEPKFGASYLPWTQAMVQESPEGIKHYRQGEWNEVIIEIQGEPSKIRFWLNGVLVTDFQHSVETTAGVPTEGYLALQVHAGQDWKKGNKVRFRNLAIKELRRTPFTK